MDTGEGIFGSFYPKGEVVFRQGDLGDRMFVIQSGAVEVSHKHADKETVIAIREKGDFFGEMALFNNEERFATVTTVCDTRLLSIDRASLLDKLRYDPNVALHLLKGLIVRIKEADVEVHKVMEQDEIVRASIWRNIKEPSSSPLPQMVPHAQESATADPAPDGVSARELADIWKVEEWAKWYEAGESIFLEGDPGDAMYIVLDGEVEMTHGTGIDEQVLRRVGAGEFFGEWALITENRRAAAATAVTRAQLLPVTRSSFAERIKARPELAVHLLQGLISRLRQVSAILSNPRASFGVVRQRWQPLIAKQEPIKIAILSLATCAGCSAVLLDDEILAQVLEVACINYCPMLIDQDHLQEADVILVDGAVRLKEDREKLEEARAKGRFLVAWGTCAAFGGVPAEANRFELEDLIAETYGHTADLFSYYLSGERGVQSNTYQDKGVALLRKAGKLDDFVKVDYYVPGCPPTPAMLLQLIAELTGRDAGKALAVVCGQCDRKPTKSSPATLVAFPQGDEEPSACFNSLGIYCQGFLTLGGCEAACTSRGLPCWGCRGPAKVSTKKMAEGNTFEEVAVQGIARRCKLEEDQARTLIKGLRRQGHDLFQIDPSIANSLSRMR
jgi:F420-non-reducing hydrogenase small subunit